MPRIERQYHFAVRIGLECVSLSGQASAQLREIVDLAIGDETRRLVIVEKRLLPARKINDAQTSVYKRHVAISVAALRIGTTMEQGGFHLLKRARR